MKKGLVISIFLLCLTWAGGVWASGYPWMYHAFPYDFLFGNNIDTHQQTNLNKNDELFGFLYVTYTGNYTDAGLPIAEHCGQNTPPNECIVGWMIRGIQGEATFVFHENDHPIWLVGSRADIPQPGAFSHFHWFGGPAGAGELVEETPYSGFFLELKAVRKFAFLHAGQIIPVSPGIDIATHVNLVGSFPLP